MCGMLFVIEIDITKWQQYGFLAYPFPQFPVLFPE